MIENFGIKCSNFRELERDLHRDYKECRIPQTEYFRLDENQLLEVSKKFKENRIPQTEYFRLDHSQIGEVNIEMTKRANF